MTTPPSPGTPASCTTDSIYLAVRPATAPDQARSYALEKFHPATGAFSSIGTLDCSPIPGLTSFINGLAIDRSGGLYVAYSEASVLRVDVTASGFVCQRANLLALQPVDLQPLGIAFVYEEDAGEALFGTFFSVPPPPSKPSLPVGIIGLDGGNVDLVGEGGAGAHGLTGTGDGRLFGIAADVISELDPRLGSVLRTFQLPAVPLASSEIPLAFWGGDFYLFTRYASLPDGGQDWGRSDVLRFHPGDGSVRAIAQVDGTVVGAAVSTCAPFH